MAVLCAARTTSNVMVVVVLMVVLGYVGAMNLVQEKEVDDTESVALMWGIADTTASVGRVFKYHIPADAFKGSVQSYEVTEAGKGSLPSWLHFVPDLNVLKGIPTPANAGQLYLEVVAHGHDGQKAADVFSVFITADTPAMSSGQPLKFKSSGPEVVRCKREEPETVATIVVDADMDRMAVEERLGLLSRFLSHMGLMEEVVKMVPAKAKLLQDDTALVTGSGDATEPRFPGLSVSWLVGCGKVEHGHFPVLQKLDDDSGTGTMGKALGHPVLGWRVTNTRLQQHALKRRRRQAGSTPTPVVTIAPPTSTDATVDTTDADSMTHKVVDMSSPTFTIQPSPSEPVMPKTMTPDMPKTTPKADKPDIIQPSKTPDEPVEVTKTPTLPTRTPSPKPMWTTKGPMVPTDPACSKPDVNKPIDKMSFLVGEVINFRIPEETFSVCGKVGTSQTKLNLFRDSTTVLPKDWFLQFDQKTQTLRGMPMKGDEGMYSLNIVAFLMEGTPNPATTSFRIQIKRPKGRKSRVNHELSMTIDTDYDDFVASVDNKVDLANKVASVFGDDNPSALTVTRIARGSVVYAFTNNTLSGSACPVDDITALADKLVTADGSLNPEAQEKLKPWVLSGAATAPAGDCEGNPNFPVRSATAHSKPSMTTTGKPGDSGKPTDAPGMPDKTSKPKATTTAPNVTGVATAGKSSEDDIWITTVVPAVVIVAILLIALLIACILYRKKRKGKMNLEDQNTFVNKGAPVIFPDELDDKPNDSTKPLLIEGNPPAPPPEYHRGTSESPEPRNNHKESTPPTDEVDADIEIDATSPLYQPPPPVTASSGKQARPHVQQPYRSQPPEIHP